MKLREGVSSLTFVYVHIKEFVMANLKGSGFEA